MVDHISCSGSELNRFGVFGVMNRTACAVTGASEGVNSGGVVGRKGKVICCISAGADGTSRAMGCSGVLVGV
jgi:hypothetical protein